MRMDTTRGPTAAEWLGAATERQMGEAIASYGEERFAKQIAKAIAAARAREPIVRTEQLAAVVAAALGSRQARRERGQDPATRTFQALRILVNRELEEIALMLPQALSALASGGRLAVISFHSLEDRLVKRFCAAASRSDVPENLPIRAREMPEAPLRIIGRVTRPTDAEVSANPRARSAKLRVAERTRARLDPAFLKRITEHEPDAWRS
jgi:16S rRNA (cytosine1402-N4)-methyltransferase